MTISAINLGNNFTNSNGTAVLSGLSSGLDTKSVITSVVAAQSSQITPLQDQVKVNGTQASALTKLTTILTSLQTAVKPLTKPQSPDASSNVFAKRSSTITSNTTQAAANFLTATAAAVTAPGAYTLSSISQLATATVQETGAFALTSADDAVVTAGATAGKFKAGTFTINNGATATSITLDTGDSLNKVAEKFNDVSAATGISASVLQTTSGNYKLILTGTKTGLNNALDMTVTTPTPNLITVTDGSGVLGNLSFTTDRSAQNAQFKLNGVTMTRASNTVTDAISGVTLNLLQNTAAEPAASFTLTIMPDVTSIESAVATFADAYNNFLAFYAEQTALGSNGLPASSATLYTNTTLRTLYSQLTSDISTRVSGLSSGSPTTLTGIGINFADTFATDTTPAIHNILSVDNSVLGNTILANIGQVENIFGSNLASSSSKLLSYSNATAGTVPQFTLNVHQSTPPASYTASYTDSLGAPQTVSFTAQSLGSGGVSLNAPSDSVFAGMVLIYSGTGDESGITVSTSQGIAAQIDGMLTGVLKANTGLLADEQSALSDKNALLQKQIDSITTQVNATRSQLLARFAALEKAITAANSALNLLNAQQQAGNA